MEQLINMGRNAKAAARILNNIGQLEKSEGLKAAAEALMREKDAILKANETDIFNAIEHGIKDAMIDRLRLTEERICKMAEGMLQIVELEDPIGEVISMKKRPNGLQIGQRIVPLGVIGIIYESRPNVTADAFSLCFKTGNAVVLRGGKDALSSNKKIVEVIKKALEEKNLPGDAIQLLEDTSHETAQEFMRMNSYVDVLIPRGGANLIKTVVENSTIPVIETGTGNCHIFVDETADIDMAVRIIENAKTQRLGVCNACESLVVHEKIAETAIPKIVDCLSLKRVEVRGDEEACAIDKRILIAKEEDWGTEYLELILSLKVVSSIEEAIAHINKYNTGHSESIITRNYDNSQQFLNEIDAAAVYINASTRFTDGFEFGFGAEIGISTQKLHARGPMGLKALTTTKYIIYGNGQIRE